MATKPKVRDEKSPRIIKMLTKSLREMKAGYLVDLGSFAKYAPKEKRKPFSRTAWAIVLPNGDYTHHRTRANARSIRSALCFPCRVVRVRVTETTHTNNRTAAGGIE